VLAVPVLLLVPCLLGAADLELSADVDRTTITFGEQLLLTVIATGPRVIGLPQPKLPLMTDFKLASTTWSRYTSVAASDSGDSLRTVAFVYTLKPRRTGFLTIGSFRLVSDGKTYETQPIAVRVVPAGESVPPFERWADANGVELVCTVDRPSVFVGEQVQVTYRMFSRTRVGGVVMKDVPSLQGFWAAEVNDTASLQRLPTTRAGQPCSVTVVRRATLFPLQSGQLAVGRMTLAGTVAVGSGLFKGMQTPFTVSSAPLSVTVRPLPDSGRPSDFAGGVGKFDLSAVLSGKETRNGEPLTLEVKVSGTGNISNIGEPEVRVAGGVKLLTPTVELQVSPEGGRIRGTRTFTYSIIPRADGLNIVPAFSMGFFDPEGDTYYSLTTEQTTFVATGAARDGATYGPAPRVGLPGTDIADIKRSRSRVATPVAISRWSGLFYLLGTVVLLAGAIVGRHRRRLEADRGYALLFRARRLLRKRLRESARRLAAGDERGYYAALAFAVAGYAGDRFNVEVAGMTGSELRAALCRRGLEPAVVNRVIDFSSRCDIARFSPGTTAFSPKEALDLARGIIGAL
jgi:hypothetical protein